MNKGKMAAASLTAALMAGATPMSAGAVTRMNAAGGGDARLRGAVRRDHRGPGGVREDPRDGFRRARDDIAQQLAVGGAGCVAGGLQECLEVVVGDGALLVEADGVALAQEFLEVHRWCYLALLCLGVPGRQTAMAEPTGRW